MSFESTGVAPEGVLLTKEDFLALLSWLAQRIEDNDSMEGSLAYEVGEEPETFRVQGALRHGNSMGQGALRLLREGL
jgi:hypothetical protein